MTDLKFAFRQLRKNPGYTAVAVLTLALGIGGAVAVYSIVDKLALNPLRGTGSGLLIQIGEHWSGQNSLGRVDSTVLELLVDHLKGTAGIAWSRVVALDRETDEFHERINGLVVSTNFFQVLNIRPRLGSAFVFEEASHSVPDQTLTGGGGIVLSHSFWRSSFNSDSDVIGREIILSGRHHTILGVMPESFGFPWSTSHFWIPTIIGTQTPALEESRKVDVIGRVLSGVHQDQLEAAIDVISRRIVTDARQGIVQVDENAPLLHDREWHLQMRPLSDHFLHESHNTLLGLLGAFIFILLIVVCNLTNLAQAGMERRRPEFAVRAALGGSPYRLFRQLLLESTMLTAVGGALGAVVAFWGVRLILLFVPDFLPRLRDLRLGPADVGVVLLVSVGIGLVVGGVSFLRARPNGPVGELRRSASMTQGGKGWRVGQGTLVVTQLAVSLTLLAGAGLMFRSVVGVLRVNPGLDPVNLLQVRINFPFQSHNASWSPERRVQVLEQIQTQLTELPGVRAVGELRFIHGGRFFVDSKVDPVDLTLLSVTAGRHDYFSAVGAPIVRGRKFTEEDARASGEAVIVNQTAARLCWPGESPLGKTIRSGRTEGPIYRVVGVVVDMRDNGYDQLNFPFVYLAHNSRSPGGFNQTFGIRARGDLEVLASLLRKTLHSIAPDMLAPDIVSVKTRLFESTRQRRAYMICSLVLAGIGVWITVMGVYGVLSFSVACRRGEIGIRMALGATPHDVVRMVLVDGGRLVVLGLNLGVFASYWLTAILRNQLFGISSTDPAVFIVVTVLLLLIGALACWFPARRVARIQPMLALRNE